jgi:predicted XRE-type DNA-binding protein
MTMSESNQLILQLKKQLKFQGMTYRDVAAALHLSEPSVKRLFAKDRKFNRTSQRIGNSIAQVKLNFANASPSIPISILKTILNPHFTHFHRKNLSRQP